MTTSSTDDGFFRKFVSVITSPFKDDAPTPDSRRKSKRATSMLGPSRNAEVPLRLLDSPEPFHSTDTLASLDHSVATPDHARADHSRQRSTSFVTSPNHSSPSLPSAKPLPSQPLPHTPSTRSPTITTKRNLHTKIHRVDSASSDPWRPPETVCDGLLQKLNKNRTKWSLRWFGILPEQPHVLYWYTREPCSAADGAVGALRLETAHIRKSRLRFSPGSQSAELLFEVITPSEVLYLSAASEDDLTVWCAFLCPRTQSYAENLTLDDLELRIGHSTEGNNSELIHHYQEKEASVLSKPLFLHKSPITPPSAASSPFSPSFLSLSPIENQSSALIQRLPSQTSTSTGLSRPPHPEQQPISPSSSSSSLSSSSATSLYSNSPGQESHNSRLVSPLLISRQSPVDSDDAFSITLDSPRDSEVTSSSSTEFAASGLNSPSSIASPALFRQKLSILPSPSI